MCMLKHKGSLSTFAESAITQGLVLYIGGSLWKGSPINKKYYQIRIKYLNIYKLNIFATEYVEYL